MTEMQSDFEDWLSVNAPCVSDYEKQHIEWLMWQAWQASRAAIVVKLPKFYSERDHLSICITSDVEQALNEAGISYE